MDSLSVASASSNSRGDALSPSDADLISVTQTLAKEAYVLFQLGKYADCLKVLNQILEKKSDDLKVLHNIAIAENFQDGFSNPKRFLEALGTLKKRSSTGENTELQSVGNKGNNVMANLASTINTPQGISAEDSDASVAMFNIAVVLYHLHEYEKCFSILERLYQNIEPIDERVARHVCLLLLDVSLVCHHASRSADVISYLERVGGNSLVSQEDSGNNSHQQLANLVTKSTSAPTNVMLTSDTINSDQTGNTNGPESPLSRTLSEETLYESLISTLDVGGAQNQTRLSNDLSKAQTDESFISTSDLRLKVHLYKVWILILTRNLKAAKREVKMAMNIARGKDYSLALFLKSQLEYARNNHRKAIKLLMASVTQTESGTSALYYNNLGCIYYQLGKYQTSAVFFSKALGNSSTQRKEKPKKLLNFSLDKSVLFAYNCGLLYLASGKPALAARCFQQAGSVFFKRPLLWFRLAECCIMFSERKTDIDVKVIGMGKWRQLVLERRNLRSVVQVDPHLSLPFAKTCLLNALHLLDCPSENLNVDPDPDSDMHGSNLKVGLGQVSSNGEAKETKAANSSGIPNPLLQSSINEYEGLCGKENQKILQAVVADLAFVYLELGNAVKALAAARCLLRLPECSKVYVFLGNVYAAEAYCLLNQPKQASEHLSSYVIPGQNGNSTELPYSQEDCDIWQTRKAVDLDEPNSTNEQPSQQSGSPDPWLLNPEEAHGVMLADMAAMAAVDGEMEQAHKFVTEALSLLPDKAEVVLTAAYLDLVRGKTEDAVSKLKQCGRVRYVAGPLAAEK